MSRARLCAWCVLLACVVLVCVMLASLVVVMRVALVLAQPAGRWRAAGRIGMEHCDAGAGARWFGARSLLDRGATGRNDTPKAVWCNRRCGVVPGERGLESVTDGALLRRVGVRR
mgnify:CR=1 FL=1|jgi:hypothetical protein